MLFLDRSLATPAENLALDEALLLSADGPSTPTELTSSMCNVDSNQEILRVWQTEQTCIVVGRSSRVDDEVYLRRASDDSIPVLRRISGGASVVLAPGCFMYSLLIDLQLRPQLRMLDAAHRFVMSQLLSAIHIHRPQAFHDGTCDLVLDGRKFSGNSLRVGRNWILYHGTLLLNMKLGLLDKYLKHPPREPTYRAGRQHIEFVTNLNIASQPLITSLRRAWSADQPLDQSFDQHLLSMIPALLQQRYAQAEWNLQR